MDDPMTIVWAALGLAVAIEGMLYSLFPDAMKGMMAHVLAMPTGTIRGAGLAAALSGVFILWLDLG